MRVRNPMVIHYVHDMDRAINFYKTVFGVESQFESPGWTQLDCGAIVLALHILHAESPDPEAPLPHAGLNFEVDSIEAIEQEIVQLGGQLVELREPDSFVPVRVAMFKDCEGNGFELRQEPEDYVS